MPVRSGGGAAAHQASEGLSRGADRASGLADHCFFVDKSYRGKGVANAALEGALKEIARRGGGTVESYPEDMEGRSTSASFLYNGTLAMFEQQGFTRTRQLGKNHWLVAKALPTRRSR